MKFKVMSVIVAICVAALGCSNNQQKDKTPDVSMLPAVPAYTALKIASPYVLESNRNLSKPIFISVNGIPIGNSASEEIPSEWMDALYKGVSLIRHGTADAVPFTLKKIDGIAARLLIIPEINLSAGEGYTIKLSTEAFSSLRNGKTTVKILNIDGKELFFGYTSVTFYTYSNPSISRIQFSHDEKNNLNLMTVTFSEPLRLEDIRKSERAELFIDEKQVADCIEPYEDCGIANIVIPGATKDYGTMEIDGEDVKITQDMVFKLPDVPQIQNSIQLKLPSVIRGVAASLIDGSFSNKNARVEGEAITYQIDASEIVKKNNGMPEWAFDGE